MSPVPVGGPWLTLREIIQLFVAMGATQGELEVIGSDGKYRVRFLHNSENDEFVSLAGYEDDERVAPSELANWQRVLGINIPTGRH